MTKITSRFTNVVRNAKWGLILNFFSTLFAFFLRTLFIHTLGSEYLGLNGLCQSIFNTLNVMDLGLDRAMAYRLYKPLEKGDITEVNKQLCLYRKIYFVIGFIILIASIIVMPFMPILAKDDMPTDVNIYLIFALYIANNLVSYWGCGCKELVFVADQKAELTSKLHLFAFFVMYTMQAIAVYRCHYYVFTILQLAGTIFYAIVLNIAYKKNYPSFKYIGIVANDIKKDMYKSTYSMGIYRIRDILRNTLDNTIVSSMVGLVPLAMYQNYYTILSVPIMIRTTIINNVIPSLGNYSVTQERENVYNIYKMMLFADLTISGWFTIGFYQLIEDVISIWLGKGFLLPQILVYSFSFYFFILGVCDANRIIRETLGLWEKGKRVAVFETVSNVILSIVLTKIIGMAGVIIATVICVCVICIPADWKYIEKEFFGKSIKHTLWLVGKFTIWTILSNVAIKYMGNMFAMTLWIGIIVKVTMSVFFPLILFLLIFHKDKELKELLLNCRALIKR